MSKYYTISSEKLAAVTRIFNQEIDPDATKDTLEERVCTDWIEGAEHQEWIDNAKPQEIADWLASFYQ